MHVGTKIQHGFKGAVKSRETGSIFSSTSGLLRKAAAATQRTLLGCLLMLLLAQTGNSQTTGSGSIQGVVTDSSGAVVANAVVKLVEASTNVTLTVKTSSGGAYAFPNINVGTYSLNVTAPGFESFTSTGNVLEVGSSISIDAKMTVGSTDVRVEVHANGLALQTEDSTYKQTIDKNELTEMPLNGRRMTDLIQLAGGAQPGQNPGDAGGNTKYSPQSTGVSIAGAPGNAISYRLDGGDNNDYMGNENAPFPFPDAVGQFSVETSALGAQDGAHIGGLVNVVTQSGTNKYHGSAFGFIRNNYIDATSFFATSKDQLHQDQYGGTFGGHVIRNKLFAFAAYQHLYSHSSSATTTAYVPTADNLKGDFSATDIVPVAGGPTKNACGQSAVQLADPQTGVALPGNKYNQPGGPVLPAAWNAAALALLPYLPAINSTLDPSNCGHVQFAIPSIITENAFDTRVDYTINPKNNMYVRYWLDSQQIPAFYSPTNILLTSQPANPEIRYQSITIGDNYVIGSGLVNSLHFTATERQLSRGFNSSVPNASLFGIKDFQLLSSGISVAASASTHGFNVGGISNFLAVINDNVPFDLSDDLTLIRGKHQIVFGGSLVRNQLNVNNGYQGNGGSNFNGQFSGVLNKGTGDSNLDFLEGAESSFTQSKPQQNALRGWIPALYVQDTFHATPNLTINAGINWEPLFFPHDYFHRGTTFNMAAFLANQHSTVYPNAPAGTLFYGDTGVNPNFTSNSTLQFNPNFAVAYDLAGNGKTVIRAGVAYAYDQPDFFTQQRVQQNPPFSLLTSPNTTAQLCFSDPWLIGGSTANGAGCAQTGGTDVSPFPQPSVPTPGTGTTFSQQSQFIVLQSTFHSPNTLQWNASVQQQFPRGWTAQIFYTGNRTQHMLNGIPLNPAVYVPGVWGANGTGCPGVVTVGPAATASGTVGGGKAGTPCSVTKFNATKTDPNNQQARFALTMADTSVGKTQGNVYGGGTNNPSIAEANSVYGNYNGVILSVQHRFSSSFSLLTNYTWSKCLNDADPQGDISGLQFSNPNNPSVDYGRCGSDVRNIFNTSLVVKSAFAVRGITGYLINNWELAPLIRLVSGSPFTVSEGQDESFTGNGGDRPNLVPGVNPINFAKIRANPAGTTVYANQSYLNQAAFVLNNVPGTQGNISRNSFSGPMFVQDDAQISRIFPIHEKYNLDLRLEAFNFLNHPSFSNPSTGGPTFTGTFGTITSTQSPNSLPYARVFQGAVKVSF